MNPYQDAIIALQAGDSKKCELIVLDLMNNDFDNPILLFALGMSCVGQRRNGLANSLLRRAVEHMDRAHDAYVRLGIYPKGTLATDRKRLVRKQTSEAYNGIALTYKYEGNTTEALRWFSKALQLCPDDADVYSNIGTLSVNDGRPETGLAPLRTALELEPDHRDARWNLALLQLEMENWQEGWSNFDKGLRGRNAVARCYRYPDGTELPMWDGKRAPLVLAYGEQGIGDEIMFASCIPDLMESVDRVVLDCHPRLVTLFEQSFGIKCYGTRKKEWIEWPLQYKFDARTPMGSLPKFFRNETDKFPGKPYLKAGRNAQVDALPGLKVGISWVGGMKETRKQIRSVSLKSLLPILTQDVTLISMQYTKEGDEIAAVEQEIGKPIHQFDFISDQKQDYVKTAEVVNSCDLIISVNTSLIHLSGALGKQCFVLTPNKPAWRYGLKGEQMRWYESVRQFRQPRDEGWESAINRASEALSVLLAGVEQRKVA